MQLQIHQNFGRKFAKHSILKIVQLARRGTEDRRCKGRRKKDRVVWTLISAQKKTLKTKKLTAKY